MNLLFSYAYLFEVGVGTIWHAS